MGTLIPSFMKEFKLQLQDDAQEHYQRLRKKMDLKFIGEKGKECVRRKITNI
jgi:hypothetical protein